jgi:hypothetical protein
VDDVREGIGNFHRDRSPDGGDGADAGVIADLNDTR